MIFLQDCDGTCIKESKDCHNKCLPGRFFCQESGNCVSEYYQCNGTCDHSPNYEVSWFIGRGSERRISKLQLAIFFRTSKLSFKFITTITSQRQKCLLS